MDISSNYSGSNHLMDKNKPINKWYQFIPIWFASLIGITWLIYVIYKSGKWLKIKKDITSPLFLISVFIAVILIFFTKNDEEFRSREANRHAILSGLAAYFGNLDMWFAAFIVSGGLTYYIWNEEIKKKLNIQWGMDPYPYDVPIQKENKYMGEGWEKLEKQKAHQIRF
jgi:DMSO/TMAO reductase YedYZ heme-binding membrane subunit